MDMIIVTSTIPAEIVYQDTSIFTIEVADTSTITIRNLMLPALSTKYKACLHDLNKTVSIEVEF